jgi:hypothetical protein
VTAPDHHAVSVDDPPPAPHRLLPIWGAGISVALALLIALAETSRLSAQIVSPEDHRPHAINDLVGPTVVGPSATARAWEAALAPEATTWRFYLSVHLLLDVALVALMVVAAVSALGRLNRDAARSDASTIRLAIRTVRAPQSTRLRWILVIGVGAGALDLIEDLLIFALARRWIPAWVVAWTTIVKWAITAVFVVGALLWLARDDQSQQYRSTLRQWWFALHRHRLAFIVLLPVAFLSLVPRGDISDQLPDVQRSWVDGGNGWVEASAAFVVVLCTAAGLYVMGRFRSQEHPPGGQPPLDDRPDAPLWIWFVWPAVLGILLLVMQPPTHGQVDWCRLAAFCTPALVIGLVSAAMRRYRRARSSNQRRPAVLVRSIQDLRPRPRRDADLDRVRLQRVVGDAIALSLLSIGGLGLVRSFTAPLLLAWATGESRARFAVPYGLGSVAAMVPWLMVPALRWLFRVTGARFPRLPDLDRRPPWFAPGLVAITVAGLVALVAVRELAHLGVVAITVLSLAAVTLAVGAIQIAGQGRKPPEVFWVPLLKLRSTPVLSFALVIIAFASTVGAGGDGDAVHQIHRPESKAVPSRPTLTAALDAWIAAHPTCGKPLDSTGAIRVRSMPIIAAEGGGIRATFWTTTSLGLLQGKPEEAPDPCRKALFSTGASGGAVGLTLARFLDGEAAAHATSLATSTALAAGAQGLLIRDTFFAASGVGLQAEQGWTDRAAAIEDAWVDATRADGASGLSKPYLPDADDAVSRPTGHLILGSTSVGTGCRVLLSQIALPRHTSLLPEAKAGPVSVPCDGTGDPGARSYDLFAAYGSDETGEAAAGCTGNPRAATVALLASRFPYVTPSGVVGPCGPWRTDQLVDGGYAENTGLGIIIDLAPEWMRLVRTHNDAVLTAGRGTIVVPLVVFLTNGPGTDLLPHDRPITQELFVPPVAFMRGAGSQNDPSALLQRVAAVTREPLWTVTGDAARQVDATIPAKRRTFVVFPATKPGVVAPLGWTLSETSRAALTQRARDQLDRKCPNTPSPGATEEAAVLDVLCRRGFGTLGDAAAFMTALS